MILSVRDADESDYKNIIGYFINSATEYLHGMGVDPSLLPEENIWLEQILRSHHVPENKKEIFYLIWLLDETPIGHSNINRSKFGDHAYMHLHMWENSKRKSGLGFELLKKCIPIYFHRFQLQMLNCEPFAHNIGPNKTLARLGFDFVKEYHGKPGLISFPQSVNQWQMSYDKFLGKLKEWS